MHASDDQISGSVERITFYNEENGYTVLRLRPDSREMLPYKYPRRGEELVTVVGNLPALNLGEWVKLGGQWMSHPKHGRQFKAANCEQAVPATTAGIKRYLGSGMIRGIGKVMAERIVDHFGEDTLDIIELEPARLTEVQGIGRKRIDGIQQAWEEQREIKNVMLFLQSHGVSTNLAIKIYKAYGNDALKIVKETPYKMVRDIHGIGFLTADRIAQAIGLAHDDPNRIEAGIAHTLNQKTQKGHVYMPQDELEPEASEILGVSEEQVTTIIEQLETSDLLKRDKVTYTITQGSEQTLREDDAVYLTPLYFSEIGLSRRLQKLIDHPISRLAQLQKSLPASNPAGTDARFAQLEMRSGLKLAAQQKAAILIAVRNKVTVLTGGPGTGKTTTLRTLLDLLDTQNHSVALASPTGRAAKRLGEATGREAKTIHRLLEFQPGSGFARNEEKPLDADLVVIDEASMLDLVLAFNLIKAIGAGTHLLLVGDIDQLPSVGAGDVLNDLIASEVAAVVRLQTIFRQSADSLIIQNAHRINQGRMPVTSENSNDFFIFIKNDIAELPDLLADVVKTRLPSRFGLDPFDDIQVLAPMYQGQAGVTNLNQRLQATLNPGSKRVTDRKLGGRTFRVGDKVMQTVNNYDKSVYNGDIGRITAIDTVQQTMNISIDGTPVVYDFLEADELVHAYAISVHKSQGAEYPCVVIPVVTQHYLMLQRNLLYTAVTRAKRLVVLIGTRKAINIAVKNDKVRQRYSGLDYRLRRDG